MICLSIVNFFVPSLSEFNTDKENEDAREVRLTTFESIVREQFQLAYFGKIEYAASNEMSVQERRIIYRVLVNQKTEEKKAHEEALRKARESKKGGWRRG